MKKQKEDAGIEISRFLARLDSLSAKKEDSIPVSIFKNDLLTPYEAVTKFLKENLGLNYKEISGIINKKEGPIGVTYRNASKKMKSVLDASSTEYSLPFLIFKTKRATIFEAIVLYLKENYGLSFNKISSLLNRNYTTIWTIYRRAKKKT